MNDIKTKTVTHMNWLAYGVWIGVSVVCYYHTFAWLHYKYSQQDSYYSHGYLIPFVSAFLIYLSKDKLGKLERTSDPLGLGVIILALLVHIVGTMGDINFLSGFSLFLYILGASLYLLGRKVTRQLALPIGFLLFMFPIPDIFINYLGLPTKYLATGVGLKIIDLVGIPYLQEGFRISLPNTTLVVGTPCNGMKSLISFGALGVLFIYFADLRLWKGLLILAAIYPMAVLLNGLRIAILVYIAANYGIEKASPESYLHDLSGLAVFIVGFFALLLFVKISGRAKKG
jgi:exosortase